MEKPSNWEMIYQLLTSSPEPGFGQVFIPFLAKLSQSVGITDDEELKKFFREIFLEIQWLPTKNPNAEESMTRMIEAILWYGHDRHRLKLVIDSLTLSLKWNEGFRLSNFYLRSCTIALLRFSDANGDYGDNPIDFENGLASFLVFVSYGTNLTSLKDDEKDCWTKDKTEELEMLMNKHLDNRSGNRSRRRTLLLQGLKDLPADKLYEEEREFTATLLSTILGTLLRDVPISNKIRFLTG